MYLLTTSDMKHFTTIENADKIDFLRFRDDNELNEETEYFLYGWQEFMTESHIQFILKYTKEEMSSFDITDNFRITSSNEIRGIRDFKDDFFYDQVLKYDHDKCRLLFLGSTPCRIYTILPKEDGTYDYKKELQKILPKTRSCWYASIISDVRREESNSVSADFQSSFKVSKEDLYSSAFIDSLGKVMMEIDDVEIVENSPTFTVKFNYSNGIISVLECEESKTKNLNKEEIQFYSGQICSYPSSISLNNPLFANLLI